MDAAHIYADVAASGAKDYNSRDQWHRLDQQLAQGDVLVVAAIDRLGRRYLETMWAIYDLQRRGVRLRSLADNEVQWTKYLDADPDSPEAFMGNVLASMAAYVASQERQNISRRTRAGLDAARAKGVELGRPRRLTDEQLTAIRQDVEEGMPVAAGPGSTGCPGPRSAAPWPGWAPGHSPPDGGIPVCPGLALCNPLVDRRQAGTPLSSAAICPRDLALLRQPGPSSSLLSGRQTPHPGKSIGINVPQPCPLATHP